MFQNSIKFIEPLRGQQFMILLNDRTVKNQLLAGLLPWTADIFVFTYPIYLVGLYLRGLKKKNDYFKHAAFAIAFSAGLAAIINNIIQFFGDKSRPETAISLRQNLLLEHLPTDPFPSDHAAVSAAIAMSTMLWGIKHKDSKFLKISVFFWFASGVMSFSRVAVAIHWPTDIIVGVLVGVLSAVIIFRSSVWNRLLRHIGSPLMRLQEKIRTVFGW